MANINFGLLDTQYPEKLANAFVRSPEQQNANMLQAMQMQQLMDQREQAQYALGKSRREETGLAAFGEGLRALGPDPDPDAVAQLFIKHPDKAMQQAGVEMLQRSQANRKYLALKQQGGAGSSPVAVAPAPGSPAVGYEFAADMTANRAALPSFGDNKLAATVAAPAAPAAARTRESRIAQLQREAANLVSLALPGTFAKTERDSILEEIKDLRKTHVMAPGSVLDTPGVDRVTAPAAPSEFEKLLKDSGLSQEEQRAARVAKVGKDSTTISEFSNVLAQLGRTKDPSERQQLQNRLTYLSTHAPGTNVKVNAYMPASEEAQRDFMKSTRATYDTLKQSPSMFANIEASKKLIPAASVFMGTGGEGMKAAASFLNNRLGMNVNTEGVKTAEELRSRLFQGILANLKRLDSQPSERQQAALEQALGSLNTDPNALSNVLDSYADTVRTNIDTHNAEVQSAISRGVKFPYDPIIKVPAKANAPEVWVRDASGKLVKQ